MNHEQRMLAFVQRAIQTRSYSNQEGELADLVKTEMKALGYDEVGIDSTGNVVGRLGHGPNIIQFDSHMDTVEVNDEEHWQVPPFSGAIHDGCIWGRGSVDTKSALGASIYAAARAKELGYTEGKTIFVTATVCEEFCDGENLKHLYEELAFRPNYCIICEPSSNMITLGHKGKAQIRVTTQGVAAHGSAPEKGKNAVYEMAAIVRRVEELNRSLHREQGSHGTIVLSEISSVSASLNAVPSQCSIYLDRRLAVGETLEQVRDEMQHLIAGKDATCEVGRLHHTTWKGKALAYEPIHNPWTIAKDHALTQALVRAYTSVYQEQPSSFDLWDFGTNAITPVSMGVPTIGFGPGDYKLAHMRNERCPVHQVIEAYLVYCRLIKEL